MKRILCFLAAVVAAACSATTPTEDVGTISQSLTPEDAVRKACHGSYPNHGFCMTCVAAVTRDGHVVSDFADSECRAKCITTTCAIQGVTCGTIPDGCGTTLICGDPCP